MESQVRRKLGLIGMQPPYRYRRDFPYGLLEFCSEDAHLITVRRTGPIEMTLPLNRPSSVPAGKSR